MGIDISEIELSDEQRKQIAEVAERTGRPWREVVRSMLQLGEAAPQAPAHAASESLYDALQQDGLIGCIKGAPADLSTHPRHLEGFGAVEPSSC